MRIIVLGSIDKDVVDILMNTINDVREEAISYQPSAISKLTRDQAAIKHDDAGRQDDEDQDG